MNRTILTITPEQAQMLLDRRNAQIQLEISTSIADGNSQTPRVMALQQIITDYSGSIDWVAVGNV